MEVEIEDFGKALYDTVIMLLNNQTAMSKDNFIKVWFLNFRI